MVIGALALVLALQGPQAPLPQPMPEVITRARVDVTRGVDFHALIVPETVYVGQQATYQLGVFVDQDTRQRIRRNPEFQPPETRSLLSYDLRERAAGSLSGSVNGRHYEMHVFRRALFPLTPGRYAIPAARLTYTLPQTASYFSREETYALRSEPVDFIAIEPPLAGRPPDWSGAVGVWHATARIDTLRGRVGEPFILTLRVEGQGNVTLLPRPPIAMTWAAVVTADERVRLDSTASLLGGWKEFDWLVTPTASGAQRVQPLRYAYFNPSAHRYEIATTDGLSVRIAAGDVADAPGPDAAPPPTMAILSIRSSLGEEQPPPLGGSRVVILLAAIAPVVAFLAWLVRRPRRLKPAPTPRQRLEVLARNADGGTAVDVRRAFTDGLTSLTSLDGSLLTERGAWTVAIRKCGVSAATASDVEALLHALDAACFAQAPVRQPHGARWVDQVRVALDTLEGEMIAVRRSASRPRRRLRATSIVMLTLLCGSAAAAQSVASEAFAQGRTAYAGGDYLRAVRNFEDAARSAPRSAAAWENLGTAALMVYDTATTVVGWQRALRLDPTNGRIRERLATLRVPQDSRHARVAPVPDRVAALFALTVWLAGWGFTARLAWRRRLAWRIGAATAVVGGGLLWAAWQIESRLEGRDLVVVTARAPLRALPALAAEARATPLPGEVASVIEKRGVWVHLRLDGARDGWMPMERVAPLGRD